MTILDAIKSRHSVRTYADKPIDTGIVALLRAEAGVVLSGMWLDI